MKETLQEKMNRHRRANAEYNSQAKEARSTEDEKKAVRNAKYHRAQISKLREQGIE